MLQSGAEGIGDFVVLSFHDVRNAASLHRRFQQRSVDAAVIDSAYIVSRLHLAVALHRIMRTPFAIDPSNHAATASAARKFTPTARDVFATLSHTRCLDRVLQRLTCAETTRAVVIVLSAPTAEQVAAVAEMVEGVPHGLSSLAAYCDEAAVREFYGVGGGGAATLEETVVNCLATADI